MYMYIHMYVSMYVCIYTLCMYMHVCVCTYVHTSAYKHTSITNIPPPCLCSGPGRNSGKHGRRPPGIYIHTYMYVYIYIYIYIYIVIFMLLHTKSSVCTDQKQCMYCLHL